MNDYHVHTRLCKHGEGDVYQYVEFAIDKGIKELGFAEHIPIPGLDDPDGRMDSKDFAVYINDIENARRQYPEIKILLGLEADYLPGYMEYIASFIKQYPFDYIIGSVHFIGDWDFSNPLYKEHYETFGVDRTFCEYYQLVREAAMTGLYDIIGHLDIPKRYGHKAGIDLTGEIDDTLQVIKRCGLALDVNTSGLRRQVQELYPSQTILGRAFAFDIPVVPGSDAHKPDEVAYAFPETYALLQKIGYHETCVYEHRVRKTIPLYL